MRFTTSWPLEQTMVFEKLFHRHRQMTLREKRSVLAGAECVWLYDGRTRELVGETYGVPVDRLDEEGEEGTAILPAFREQGWAKILKAFFLGRVSQKGFRFAIGHARAGTSIGLNEFFGGRRVRARRNWYGSGETYYFYVLTLRGLGRGGSTPRRQ